MLCGSYHGEWWAMFKSEPISWPQSFFTTWHWLHTGLPSLWMQQGWIMNSQGPFTIVFPGSLYPVLQNVNLDVTGFSTDDLSQSLCLILGKKAEIDEKRWSLNLCHTKECNFSEWRRATKMGFSTLVIHWNHPPHLKCSHSSTILKIPMSNSRVGICKCTRFKFLIVIFMLRQDLDEKFTICFCFPLHQWTRAQLC